MGINSLMARLGTVPVTSVTANGTPAVTSETAPALGCTAVTSVTSQNDVAARDAIPAHLLALAAGADIDAGHVHRLHDADLAGCIGLDARQLAAYLAMLADTADRYAGRVPLGDTARMLCKKCGPVWIHPTIAEVLPVVGGWPRALGCPWCFVRKADGYIPRPPVTCEGCRHFRPDTINPEAGMGTCGAGKGVHYPMARHACGAWRDSP